MGISENCLKKLNTDNTPENNTNIKNKKGQLTYLFFVVVVVKFIYFIIENNVKII